MCMYLLKIPFVFLAAATRRLLQGQRVVHRSRGAAGHPLQPLLDDALPARGAGRSHGRLLAPPQGAAAVAHAATRPLRTPRVRGGSSTEDSR